ncbi:MAG: hypothetical protein WC089_02870 [Candidatus Paceibacterota bacterium]
MTSNGTFFIFYHFAKSVARVSFLGASTAQLARSLSKFLAKNLRTLEKICEERIFKINGLNV